MFVASNHRQDRYPATYGCTKSSIDDPRVIGPAKILPPALNKTASVVLTT
jgi:hypothetical protein